MSVAAILDECLADVAAGQSLSDCLARYPDQAAELAPMLKVAAQLRGLAAQELSPAQRLAGQVALRAALACRAPQRAAGGRLVWPLRWMGRPALAAAVAFCLFLVLSLGAVAASQPGDLAYGVRVVIERAPVLVIFAADERASAELNLAERRLADVGWGLEHHRQVDAAALRALIGSLTAAAGAADGLPEVERLQVAARIEEQAARLEHLTVTAGEPAATRSLAETVRQAYAIAVRLRPKETPPEPEPRRTAPTETTGPRPAPTLSPTMTPQVGATATPTPAVMPTGSRSSPAPQPSRDGTVVRSPEPRPHGTETGSPVPPVTPHQMRATATPMARPTHTVLVPSATRRVGWTITPPQPPTAGPPAAEETRRPEPTVVPPATAQPRPTGMPGDHGGGPPAITPGPPPEPRPPRRGS